MRSPLEALQQFTVSLQKSMVFGLLCLSNVAALAYFTIARPLDTHHNPVFVESDRGWLWGWTWGTESTVSVIDHNPVVSFPSRPGMF